MRREEYVAIVVVLCAALIGASVMLRDATGITGAATANLPPAWQADSTKFALATNTPLALNLDALFRDPEGSELTFITTQTENLHVEQQDNTLVITPEPGFAGERVITVIASDGEHIATKRLKIEVGDGFAPTAAPEPQPAPVQEPQDPLLTGTATSPAPDKVEDAVEEALADEETVEVIIVLRKDAPEPFAAKATKSARAQALENIKDEVEENREELLGRVNDVPAITGAVTASVDFEITHEYETINAIAVKLTRAGLAKLRNDPLVEQIVLDRELTADLADSVPLISANDAWNLTAGSANLTGKGEIICILDTGIDFPHPAFADKTFTGYDFRNEDDTPQDDAFNSHGTHVAGIALGNSSAVKGVAPDAKALPAKVCDNTGSCTGSDLLAGIDFCNNKSAVINISAMSVSIGDGGQYNSTTCPTSFDAALNTSVSLGIIPVFASGNSGYTDGINFPACSPYAISVGSTTKSDAISSFSNRGGDRLDILAPGSSIVSSIIGGGTGTLSGTSMATPHVSGLIALIQQNQRAQHKPILSIAEMRALLRATGKEISLWNRIDAYAAIVLLNQNYTINLTDNSVTNMSPPKAKVKFKNDTDFGRFIDCSRVKHNFIHIDSDACPQFNKSAHITFEGLAGDTATPLRNGESCPADICQNITFSSGVLEFDVTSFTNFSSESNFSTQDVVTNCDPGPVVINTSTTLTNSISSNGTCLTTNASNIVIDCDGFSIGFNANGSGTAAEFGINTSITSGVTVRDCTINDLNSTSGGADVNFMFDRANYTAAVNVTIISNGTTAVYFSGGHNNTIANSTVRSNSITDGPAVRETNITGNLLDNVSISFTGTGNLIAFNTFTSNTSTIIQQSGNARILYNNATIRTSVNSPRGIDTDPAGPFEITGNKIFVHTSGTGPTAFRFASSNGNISNNTFLANGTGARGISIQAAALGTFTGNNFTVMGASSTAIEFLFGVSNATRFTDTIISSEAAFIDSDPTNANTQINFTNTTFQMPNGSINIIERAHLNRTQNVTLARLNITNNRAYLNSSNLTFLNQTGIVTLENIGLNDPKPQFDFEDDGTFTDCTSTADPFCTELSYSGGTFRFNTSHFTTFQTAESGAVNLTGCATVNASSVLTQNVTSTGTCIILNNDSITLDCDGFTIAHGSSGGSSMGIQASHRRNITIRDCIIRDTNVSGGGSHSINLSGTNNSAINNNTLVGNGSGNTEGIRLQLFTFNNTIANNVFFMYSTGGAAIGILGFNTGNITIANNTITSTGNGTGGFYVGVDLGGDDIIISNNTVNTSGPGTNNWGIYIHGGPRNNLLLSNTIRTNGTSSFAIRVAVALINISAINTLINQTTADWLQTDEVGIINITNTTFAMPNGSIRTPGTAQVNQSADITLAKLNMTSNRAFLNSNNLTFLNTTGIITLNGITAIDPKPQVAFNDATFADCTSTADPFCTEISYAGDVFVFNTSHFTSFQAGEAGTANLTGCATINASSVLTQNVNSTANQGFSCILLNNDNITFNCNGFHIRGNGSGLGINATARLNVTITNCVLTNFSEYMQVIGTNNSIITNILAENSTAQVVDGMTFRTENSYLNNITVLTNSTFSAIRFLKTAGTNVRNNSIGNLSGTNAFSRGVHITIDNSTLMNIIGISNVTTGVDFDGTSGSTIANALGRSTSSHGIQVQSTANNNRFNNITGQSTTGDGIRIGTSIRNNFTNTTGISGSGTGLTVTSAFNQFLNSTFVSNVQGLNVQGGVSNAFNGTFIRANTTWIFTTGSTETNFSNTTFVADQGSITIIGNATLSTISEDTNVSARYLNITNNRAFLNSSNLTFFNQTGIVRLNNISFGDPKPQFDFEDDGTFADCTSTANPFCTEISYGSGTFVFNTSHFTTFQSTETATTVDNCSAGPVIINQSTTLTQNVTSNGTCITFGASNIALDCDGFSIFFDVQGQGSDGVGAANLNNVTVLDCLIHDLNSSGSNNNAVNFTNTSNGTIRNNTIIGNGTSSNKGIQLINARNNTVANNTIRTRSSGTGGTAISVTTASIDNLVAGNTIIVNGTGGTSGIIMQSSSNNTLTNNTITMLDTAGNTNGITLALTPLLANSITNNVIFANGTSGSGGISLSQSLHTLIANNTIQTFATGDSAVGIVLATSTSNTTVTGNNISVSGTTINRGIRIFSSANNTFISNSITATGPATSAVVIIDSNASVFNNTILANPVEWLNSTGDSTNNNFTNTSFLMPNGSIRFTGTFTVSGTQDVLKSKLNITSNRAFVNSSNLTFLNTTAVITLNGITATDPKPQVAFNDATFVDCTSTANPFCTELAFSGGVFIFNTSHFTTFQSAETATTVDNCSAGPVIINTSSTLTQNLSSTGTCITFGAHNIALNCANFNITYGTGNANDAMGVNITGFANATVVNCNIRKGGAGGNRTYGIGAFGATNIRLENNTVITNGTGTNDAIHIAETSEEFIPPGTVTLVNNDGNVNSPFCTNATGTNSCQVCFSSPFSVHTVDCTSLGQSACSDGEGFESETVLSFNNTANITQGTISVIGGEAVTCAMNGVTILSFGTRNNCGTFSSQTFNGSSFVTGQNNLSCSVAGGGKDEDNGFKLVKFTYTTGSTVVVSNTTDVAVQNNVLVADGGNDARGIFIQALRSNITRNNVTTAGNRNNHGIYALEANNRVMDNVVRTVAGNQSNGLLIAGNTSTVTGNNVSTANSSASHGILMDSTARDSIIANNTIHVTALASDAVRVRATAGLYVNNTVIGATQAALFLESALSNRFNSTFLPASQSSLFVSETQGTVNFTEPINITNLTNISQVLSVTLNRTFLNATDSAGQQFNKSALLQLFSLSPDGARPVFDDDDDGSFSNCNAPRCRNSTFNHSAGILQFNATLWTTYAGQAFPDCTTLDNDDNITQINFTMDSNITSSLTCLDIVGENVTVNCAGFTIFYDSAGGGGDGIVFTNPKNLLIENCTLVDINAGGSGGTGLNGSNASHVIIRSNSITTNGTSANYGIHLVPGAGFGNNTVNNTIANNTIRTFGTSTDNIGIRVEGRMHNNTIRENTIVTNGTSANYGMFFFNRTRQNFILSNRVNTTGNDAEGIVFDRESLDNTIANNTIHVNNSGSFTASGVYILNEAKANNTISSNSIVIRSVGSVDPAIHFEAGIAENNTVANNTITVLTGGASEGVRFFNSGSTYGKNNIIENNTISVATNSTTFGDTGIFIRQNNNTIIRHNTIRVGNATPANNLALASDDVGITIHLTEKSIIANNTITVLGLGGSLGIQVRADSYHNKIENNSIFLEANGSRGAGIQLIVDFTGSGIENNTVRGNTVRVRSNDSNSYGTLITGNVTGNFITHNDISINGSEFSMGVRSESLPSDGVTTQDNVIEFNNITARGTGSHNYGVFLYNTARRHNVTNNNITTHGADRNHGIFINASSTDGIVRENNITLLTAGFDNYGIFLSNGVTGTLVRNNRVRTNGTGNNTGVRVQSVSNSNIFSNNSIITNATGLVVNSSRYNQFLDSNVSAGGSEAVRLEDSFDNNFTGIVLATDGGIAVHAPGGVLAGSFADGFEDGTLSPFTTTGNASWTANDSAANTGTFSAKAGTIGNSQRSSLILNLTLAAPGTISFARRISSEQDFDFLRFAIDGAEQQTWSGESPFETFAFSVSAGTHLFAWNYTKDSSGASGNDTAWIDDVTIITDGAASQNNTFIRTILYTNNTWLFAGVNSTNNTFHNTTFEGANGSITLIPATHLQEGTNATIARLNISFNRAYLNSSNLPSLNRSGIVRLRGITVADPSPTVDLQDDGTFADCTSTADPFCTELSFSGGVFAFNTSHFTAFSSTEPSTGVTLTLTKSDTPDPVNASAQLNYTILVNLTAGNASNITLTDTYPAQVIFLSSQPSAISGTNNTFVIGNLSANATFTVNITVLVLNVTNGTVINNTANISFQNQSGNTLTLNVTENTTVLNPPVFNLSNVSMVKLDSPDPVNASGNLSYTIVINATADSPANVTLTDQYPSQVVFLTAQPTPISGTNNTFVIGNLTNGTSFSVNITVLVLNISNGTVINNTANISFHNQTGATLTASATASTTVTNLTFAAPAAPAGQGGGSGGGGNGGGGGVNYDLQQPQPEAPACVESWACEDWQPCVNGLRVRMCVDQNNCGTIFLKPGTGIICETAAAEQVQSPAAPPEAEPLALPELQVPQTEETTPETFATRLCAVLPTAINGALLVLAVLVILYWVRARKGNGKAVRAAADIVSVIILAALITEYVVCKQFLPVQYVAFVVLVLAIIAEHIVAIVRARGSAAQAAAMTAPPEPADALQPAPVPALPARIAPPVLKQAAEAPPTPIPSPKKEERAAPASIPKKPFWQPAPKKAEKTLKPQKFALHEEATPELKEVFSTLQGSGDALEQFNKRLAEIEKNMSKYAKRKKR